MSSVKRDVSRLSSANTEFVPIARANRGFAMVAVPVAIGNAVARTRVMRTLALRDPLTLKEQT